MFCFWLLRVFTKKKKKKGLKYVIHLKGKKTYHKNKFRALNLSLLYIRFLQTLGLY